METKVNKKRRLSFCFFFSRLSAGYQRLTLALTCCCCPSTAAKTSWGKDCWKPSPTPKVLACSEAPLPAGTNEEQKKKKKLRKKNPPRGEQTSSRKSPPITPSSSSPPTPPVSFNRHNHNGARTVYARKIKFVCLFFFSEGKKKTTSHEVKKQKETGSDRTLWAALLPCLRHPKSSQYQHRDLQNKEKK